MQRQMASLFEVWLLATTTTKAITVEGGPLANDITETGEEWPFETVNGNRTIPAGTDIQTILEKLFLKEMGYNTPFLQL